MNRSILRLQPFNSICFQCRQRLARKQPPSPAPYAARRLLTTTSSTHADTPSLSQNESTLSGLSSLSRHTSFAPLSKSPSSARRPAGDPFSGFSSDMTGSSLSYRPPPKPHHLHIYATRHNCHITLSAGNRDAILSVSAGNLNFRKAARGSYDAAFQLGAFVMAKIKNMGLLNDQYPGKGGPIRALEVVLRDFGPGREAVTKILMGQEGKEIRRRVTRVMDGTRLKFGGTRSPKPRRLG